MTLDKFFHRALEVEKTLGERKQVLYFTNNIVACKSDAVLEAYNEWKEQHGHGDPPRISTMDFQIAKSKLSHKYDLECFANRVDHVIKCHENVIERAKYVGPYFCFVQSSGMGKTKLLYEYKKKRMSRNHQVTSFLIFPPPAEKHQRSVDTKVNSYTLDLSNLDSSIRIDASSPAKTACQVIFAALDTMLERLFQGSKNPTDIRKVALLFDDSQYLLKEEFGYDAFRFRCIRLWLTQIPRAGTVRFNRTVVAVFSGTSLKVTNLHVENDDELVYRFQSSRDVFKVTDKYYDMGFKFHDPFSQTLTIGACLGLLEGKGSTEYDRAIGHGRPLFAQMAKTNALDKKLPSILLRMLRRDEGGNISRTGKINILSTRVQLGQVPADVASDLVANTYANLCAYNSHSRAVLLAYMADPVPARLAMMMMDDNQTLGSVKGQNKQWWSETLMEIISTGMINPDKGDYGEVAGALYMLFCGDLLRQLITEKNKLNETGILPYSQFSVSLDAWLQLMLSGGKFPVEHHEACQVSVGFIQVCRNQMRSYEHSWKCLNDQDFLKHIFESGIAFYTFAGCDMIDMVVPMRIKSDDEGNIDGFCYAPMMVSIRCRVEYTQNEAETECKEMKDRATEAGMTRALCLLIVFGSEEEAVPFTGDIEIKNDATDVSDLIMAGVVAKAIRVPTDDEFGLSATLDAMVSRTQVVAEVFASHQFLKGTWAKEH